ncbi:hypothetical protein GCM10010518_40330 [Kitasatospora cinereorecta]
MNLRAPPTASNRAGSVQEAEPDTADGSMGGSPSRNGSSIVDPFVPMRGTPGIRGCSGTAGKGTARYGGTTRT